MAETLVDLAMTAANAGKLVLAEIADWFCRDSNIAQNVVWATDPRLSVQITSWKTLPTVSTRKINAGFSESSGKFQQKVEGLYIFGHYIDVDTVLETASPGQRQLQRKMSARAMSFKFNDMFINGDPASDEFKGLKMRVDDVYAMGGIYTGQYIDGGSATPGRGVNYDSTERQYFLDKLNELGHAIAEHKPDAYLLNDKLYLCFESCFRRESLFSQVKDQYDRVVNAFKGVPLIDMGVNADQTTEVITNTETLSGGTDETSIYAIKYGEKEYLWGLQQEALDVKDLGILQTAPKYRDQVQWVIGLAVSNPKAIARAYGFVADSGAS
jgi:hypothetical protein